MLKWNICLFLLLLIAFGYGGVCKKSKSDKETSSGNSSIMITAPSVLTATAISSTQINLIWTNVTGETGYEIERSPITNTNYIQLATVGTDILLYSDTTITEGNTYYYKVRAYNVNGYSAYSNEVIITTGLIAWWKFDETSGITATDSSGNGNNGTVYGATWSGGVLSFDGVNDYVVVPNLDRNQFTFTAWIKRDRINVAVQDRLIMSVNSNGWGIGFNPNNTFFLTKVAASQIDSTTPITDTTGWHFLVVTYDGSNARFYIDGNLDSSPAYSTTFSSGGGNYTIGSRLTAEYFQGVMDEVKIYNYVRSATDIQADYNAR
jgi:hypothetical protein